MEAEAWETLVLIQELYVQIQDEDNARRSGVPLEEKEDLRFKKIRLFS